MSQGPAGIERARRDVAEGRPWRARERLGSFLASHPAHQEARELLGEVHHAMGDVPAAGAAWFLTTREDARAREAIAVLQEEHRRSLHGLLGALRVRLPVDDPAWPEPVAARLRELATEAERQGIVWRPGANRVPPQPLWAQLSESGGAGGRAAGGCLRVLGGIVAGNPGRPFALLGFATAIRWLFRRGR